METEYIKIIKWLCLHNVNELTKIARKLEPQMNLGRVAIHITIAILIEYAIKHKLTEREFRVKTMM